MSLRDYLIQLYLLTAAASLLGIALRWLRMKAISRLAAKAELKLHTALGLACLIVPFFAAALPSNFQFAPMRKNFVAESFRDFDRKFPGPLAREPSHLKAAAPVASTSSLLALLLLGALVAPTLDLIRLRRALKRTLPWKKIGKVRLGFSETASAPFSTHWAGLAWVVVPVSYCSRPAHLKMAVAHEIQHHRQRDTLWLYLFFVLRALTPFHPLRAYWLRQVEEAQEEACDEALVDQGRVERREYSRCLLEVAEISVGRRNRVAGAANFFPSPDRNNLKRRIERMYESKKGSKFVSWGMAMAMGCVMAGTALASSSWVSDQQISLAKAQEMAEVARRGSDFPIVVNELVLRQLNRYLGTEQGRKFLRESRARMEPNLTYLKARAFEHNVPEELFTVGMAESGYQNLPPNLPFQYGAGVWQFIESTARRYGLKVEGQTDERMNFHLSTDAAFRYLKSNQLMLGDWMLAVMAYNIGENKVFQATKTHRTNDVWELLAKGVKTDPDYLPRVMAMVLILKNPESLE